MNVAEVFEFLESREQYGSQPGLDRICCLLDKLDNPENRNHIIHIAGTNGKGSVGAYLESILRKNSQSAFHFSSPAVFDRMDVWRSCGDMITEEHLIQAASSVHEAVRDLDQQSMHPTRFEVETAIAFYAAKCVYHDYLILEAGLGGLQDATNVVNWPKTCVFTNISYDHMQFLGETLTEIATEKAGIIQPGNKVFSAEQEPEVKAVLDEKMIYGDVTYVDSSALELISHKPGELKFRYKGVQYETTLSGLYQMKNAALAIEVAQDLKIPEDLIAQGIKEVQWDGRFQVLSKEPYFIMDGAHNVDAIKQLKETIKSCFTNEPINFIIGVLKDKEHEKMMELIAPMGNKIYTITPQNARGMDGNALAEEIRKWNTNVISCESVEEAVDSAMDQGQETGIATVAFGSLSYLSEVKKCHDNYVKK